MELTISQVAQSLDVTPRMLRHYEKMGLITPFRKEDYAYRCYDEEAVKRLQLIIVMRKLRIPLKKIAVILNDGGSLKTLEILREKIAELDGEIKSLETVRSALDMFVSRLDAGIREKARLDLLGDTELMETVSALSLSGTTLKEKTNMSELNQANETLNKDLNVRIIRLPPMTVASCHCIGEDPEEQAFGLMTDFVQKIRLYDLKPDARMLGFNRPNPGVLEDGTHGYEVWVTIPEDMELPEPFVKKHYNGKRLYAVTTIRFPEFQIWGDLINWVNNSEQYETDYTEEELAGQIGGFEEELNWAYGALNGWPEETSGQLDIMVPIKKR